MCGVDARAPYAPLQTDARGVLVHAQDGKTIRCSFPVISGGHRVACRSEQRWYAAAAAQFIERFPAAKIRLARRLGLYKLTLMDGRFVEGFARAFERHRTLLRDQQFVTMARFCLASPTTIQWFRHDRVSTKSATASATTIRAPDGCRPIADVADDEHLHAGGGTTTGLPWQADGWGIRG
jgi:hypothetical protein